LGVAIFGQLDLDVGVLEILPMSVQEEFVFTRSGAIKVKSLKFAHDTVFSTYIDNYLDTYYYLLNDEEIDKINYFLDAMKYEDYKTEYINENMVDGFDYQFEFLDSKKRVYVYGIENQEIQLLSDFSEYLRQIDKSKQKTFYGKSNVNFGNLEQFYPPEPEIDSVLLHQYNNLHSQ